MALPSPRDALARLRDDRRREVRLAYVLWIVFAAVVWNVVFDRVLVLAGRRYAYDAINAVQAGTPPLLIAPVMSAAQADAVWLATVIAIPIAAAGVVAVLLASRRGQRV